MTPAELSAILVHYHAAELAAQAVTRLRDDLARLGLAAEILVVDNGSDPAGRRLLTRLPARLIEPGANLGYAGGANLGVREARGRWLVVMNPDVLVLPGCCSRLVEELAAGAGAAGPRFYWDAERSLLLPPTEEPTRRAALLAHLAPAAPALAAVARRRWRRHARRHWLATGPFESVSLSGALLAFRRDAWERVGPFDEGFPLYFEETDWLLRLARAGLAPRYVPTAEAVHLYDRSASAEPRSRAWFAESRRRFEGRHYGGAWAAVLGRAGRLARPPGGEPPAEDRPGPGEAAAPEAELTLPAGAEGPLWVEVSPSPLGFPAAAERIDGPADGPLRWRLPDEVWHRLTPGPYRVRAVDARGVEGPVTLLSRD